MCVLILKICSHSPHDMVCSGYISLRKKQMLLATSRGPLRMGRENYFECLFDKLIKDRSYSSSRECNSSYF
jgi:hypothetical protein